MLRKTIKSLVFLSVLTLPVHAAPTIEYYGSMAFGTWWGKEWDFTDSLIQKNDFDTIMGEDPSPVTNLDIMPFGTLGLDIAKENLKFLFELGIGKTAYDFKYGQSATSGNFLVKKNGYFARFNKFYADWSINDHLSLQIGQNTTPAGFSTSSQAYFGGNGLNNCGVLDNGNRPMLQFQAKNDFGNTIKINAKAAVIMVDTMLMTNPTDFRTKDTMVTDSISGQMFMKAKVIENIITNEPKNLKADMQIPKIESSLEVDFYYKLINYRLQLTGGFQQYSIVFKKPIDYVNGNVYPKAALQSYVWGVDNKLSLGAVSIGYSCSGGKNLGIYGTNIGNPFKWRGNTDAAIVNIFYPWAAEPGTSRTNPYPINTLLDPEVAKSAKTVYNSYALEMAGIGRIQPWHFMAIEGGYGLVKVNHDDELRNEYWHDTHAWYGQIEITIAKTFTITPEVGNFNYGPRYTQGKLFYWGMNSKVKF